MLQCFYEKIEIKKIGSFLKTDENGYLINPASKSKIKGKWKQAVEACVLEYKKEYGDDLVSVYIRGSVAKGKAVEGLADLDTFAFVDLPDNKIDNSWRKKSKEKLKKKFPFCEGFEITAYSKKTIKDKNIKIILIQACCVYGKEFKEPKLKIGKSTILHGRVSNSIKHMKKVIVADISKNKKKIWCAWFAKRILRTGFELTMTREKKYTRDLYLCYKTFSKYYPQYEKKTKEVLNLSLNRTSSSKKIESMFEIAEFIEEEGKKYF